MAKFYDPSVLNIQPGSNILNLGMEQDQSVQPGGGPGAQDTSGGGVYIFPEEEIIIEKPIVDISEKPPIEERPERPVINPIISETTSSFTPTPVPAGFRKAMTLSDCYGITGLAESYTYHYVVGESLPSRSISISNKTFANRLLVRFIIPSFLSVKVGGTEVTSVLIDPQQLMNLDVLVTSEGALNIVGQRDYNHTEQLRAFISLVDVINVVYVNG
jgi:hypothetical protein